MLEYKQDSNTSCLYYNSSRDSLKLGVKMHKHRKCKFSIPCVIFYTLVLVFCLSTNVVSKSSNIVFENGVYKNVLLAINDGVEASSCQLIEQLKEALVSFSNKLNAATEKVASLGSVDVLLPRQWSNLNCNTSAMEQAKVFQTYDNADIKITNNHPIAKSLPWTKQYRGCGREAESIYIPPSFLQNSKFNDTKGNFLLHEWAKFRYGVFEEFGYYNDQNYSPCYRKSGKSYFTSCSDIVLSSIGDNISSDSECLNSLNEKGDDIKMKLNEGISSVMSGPNLLNVDKFCTAESHNRLAPTKQNFMCNRRSVNEIRMTHKDFQNTATLKTPFQSTNIDFRFLYNRNDGQGYAFLIEDSEDIRKNGGLEIVKQAITQMVNMMADGTEAHVFRYNGNLSLDIPCTKILTRTTKPDFIKCLPDQDSAPLILSDRRLMSQQIRVLEVLREATKYLNSRTYEFKLILFGSQPPADIEGAIQYYSHANFSLAIATFDTSPDWLKWNTIPHTDKVIYIPNCESYGGKHISLLTDGLLEILTNSVPRRYFNKVTEFPISGPGLFPFQIEENMSRFVAVLPTLQSVISVLPTLSSPSTNVCTAKIFLDYPHLYYFDHTECTFQTGEWTLNIRGSEFNYLQVYAELPSEDNLIIISSLGHTLENLLEPTQNIIPVYASVSSSLEKPIIDATVSLDLFTSDKNSLTLITMPLMDDGQYPDVTKHDGVYSAIITNYSSIPAPHLGQITVKTSTASRKIVNLNTLGNAALLDTDLSTKCCGSEVKIGSELASLAYSFYTATIPSFKTSENFTSSEYPPPQIQAITKRDDSNGNGDYVVLEFISPGGVNHYDICCFHEKEEIRCTPTSNSEDCVPVAIGAHQSCTIRKSILRHVYTSGSSILLYCGIRGVSSTNVTGEISRDILEIYLNFDEDKCKSISDGCLPIYIFWILIGCVAALVLTILIIGICLCCKSSKPKNTKQRNQNLQGNFIDKDSPLYNVYVNQAYIQDNDGQLKLVATDGELLPYEGKVNERGEDQGYATQNSVPHTPVLGKQVYPTAMRRRSISANAAENENFTSFKQNELNGSRKHVSWNKEDNDDMVVQSANRSTNYDREYPLPSGHNHPTKLTKQMSKSEEIITLAPRAKDRFPKPTGGYANPNNTRSTRSETTTMTPVPSISSTVEALNRSNFLNNNVDDEDSVGPIYASVNRAGHRPLGSAMQGAVPVFNRFETVPSNPTLPKRQSNLNGINNNRNSNDQLMKVLPAAESSFVPGRFSRGWSNRKSVRLDAFPSSESETYSDISRGIPINPSPPLPPPFPSASDLNRTKKTSGRRPHEPRVNGNGNDSIERNNGRNAFQQPPPLLRMSHSPPSDNSFAGIRSHIEKQMKDKQPFRPPPPPRQDKLPLSSVSSFGSKTVEMSEVNHDDDYDEGSDFWDDGDEFDDYNPGHSYA